MDYGALESTSLSSVGRGRNAPARHSPVTDGHLQVAIMHMPLALTLMKDTTGWGHPSIRLAKRMYHHD